MTRRRLCLLAGLALGGSLAARRLWRAPGGPPRIVFSDVDGTLAHYAWQLGDEAEVRRGGRVRYHDCGQDRECIALPSSTAGAAYMSLRTVELVQELRARGVLFVLITGARSSTYLARRGLLPAADFEVFENGGRVWRDGRPDERWAERLRAQTGFNGTSDGSRPPPEARPEPLWQAYGQLAGLGWRLDARDYETGFRVRLSEEDAPRFVREAAPILRKHGLASSTNLGLVDVFPRGSGKAAAARHILRRLGIAPADAVALFDDDNDVEMGDLCGRSFLPAVTHGSVQALLAQRPAWEVMPHRGPLGTEEALERVLRLLPARGGQA